MRDFLKREDLDGVLFLFSDVAGVRGDDKVPERVVCTLDRD